MKAGEFIEAIERFFLDLVGTVLPGMAMILGLCFITGKPFLKFSEVLFQRETEFEWVLLLGLAYVLGHGVISLGSICVRKKVENNLSNKLKQDPIFDTFITSVSKQNPSLAQMRSEVSNQRIWRNIALSISQENSHLVYRFTFLSLLNLGTTTILVANSLIWVGLLSARKFFPTVPVIDFSFWLVVMFAVAPLFFERYLYFSRIAFQLPFSIALAKLGMQTSKNINQAMTEVATAAASQITSRKQSAIYLAGGFLSGWQDKVIQAVPSFDYLDPRSHGFQSKADFTAWDLAAIRRSDCVFAYLEQTNPGGFALALEIGFAKALGKFVIFVDEKSIANSQIAQYMKMLTETSDVNFNTLKEGINFLKQYGKLV